MTQLHAAIGQVSDCAVLSGVEENHHMSFMPQCQFVTCPYLVLIFATQMGLKCLCFNFKWDRIVTCHMILGLGLQF
jgi:hypothetical protein